MNYTFRRFSPIAFCLAIVGLQSHTATAQNATNPLAHVQIETNAGNIVIELNAQQAPKSVSNFLKYVDEGFYKKTIFHRVIPGFMVQGGGYTMDYNEKPTRAPVPNEADNGLKNDRGTIAMARTSDPHSAAAQFFINVNDNAPLNFRSKTSSGWGYTVFGRVIKGMEVVDRIEHLPTGSGGPFPTDVPQTPVVIKSMHRI